MPLRHAITCAAPDEMARIARAARREGIGQVQVKRGASGDWRNDVVRLARVREAVGSGLLACGDWNGAATDPARVLNVCDLWGHAAPRLYPRARAREAGRIAPPEDPGLGIRPDRDRLGAPDPILE